MLYIQRFSQWYTQGDIQVQLVMLYIQSLGFSYAIHIEVQLVVYIGRYTSVASDVVHIEVDLIVQLCYTYTSGCLHVEGQLVSSTYRGLVSQYDKPLYVEVYLYIQRFSQYDVVYIYRLSQRSTYRGLVSVILVVCGRVYSGITVYHQQLKASYTSSFRPHTIVA